MMKYKVLIKITSDERGKKGTDNYQEQRIFKPGEIVVNSDFPKRVIANWIEIGVLEKVEKKQVEKSDKINDNETDKIKDGD